MMDFAHGPSGHFGGHPVPGLHHLNIGSMLVQSREVKDTLGVDFRACQNYTNGFNAASIASLPGFPIADGGSPKNFRVLYLEFPSKSD